MINELMKKTAPMLALCLALLQGAWPGQAAA
jgi:hypothetical protein